MFTDEDNELLTRVGPGTPMGELFRRFWIPFLLPEELAERDGPPLRVTLLGEKLIAFRDSKGRLGLLDRHCPHRRAELFFARNEDCGLRCTYHGWKFDVDGNVLEMPAEPENSPFIQEVKIKSYPIREWGGVIWAYMGDKAKMPPELPQFEWGLVPDSHRYVTKRLQETNYAQGVEGGIDSSHVSILHSELEPEIDRPFQERQKSILRDVPYLKDSSPKFFIRNTDYGMLIGARRRAGEDDYYWRITQFLLPFYTMIAPSEERGPIMGHAWTPIDDHNVWTFTMTWNPHAPLDEKGRDQRAVHADVIPDGSYRPIRNRDNNYLLDRERQRLSNCSGMEGIGVQDAAIQESMGSIVNRAAENLGTSDTAIVMFRRQLLRLAKALQAGEEPAPPAHPDWYRVRSAGVVLNKGIDFQEGAGPRLKAS